MRSEKGTSPLNGTMILVLHDINCKLLFWSHPMNPTAHSHETPEGFCILCEASISIDAHEVLTSAMPMHLSKYIALATKS
ncbi:MAG TPA: hypothetical protein DCP63_13695 [Bacteroidetes bacterium]|nr:hypothetical protein [Bacteroidota bacterium]